MSLIMTEPFIVISSDKLKPNTLLFQFPVLPAHGFDSDECTMRNISERDNLGRRTEFHLSAILKHLVGRNNAVVLVDDGKNQCSVKNHFVSFNVLLVSISFVWFIGKDNGFGVILAKKATLQSKHFHFCRQKHVNEKCQRLNLLKGSDFSGGKALSACHIRSLFGFLLYFLAIMASPAYRQIVLLGILKSFGKKYVKLQKAQGNANVCVISLWFLAAYC